MNLNEIILKGLIKNIKFSHEINNTIYDQADLIVNSKDNKEDNIRLIFKKCVEQPLEEDIISIIGSVRSYTQHLDNNKNRVSIYVSTYFDPSANQNILNRVELDGRICNTDQLRTTKNGKINFHCILANNIYIPEQNLKINNYLPLVFWGKLAQSASELKVNDQIKLDGQLHSRVYTKTLENGEKEIRTAHEIVVLNYEKKL